MSCFSFAVVAPLDFIKTVANILMAADLPYSGKPILSIRIYLRYPDVLSLGLDSLSYTVTLYQKSEEIQTITETSYLPRFPQPLTFEFDGNVHFGVTYTVRVTKKVENGQTEPETLTFTNVR